MRVTPSLQFTPTKRFAPFCLFCLATLPLGGSGVRATPIYPVRQSQTLVGESVDLAREARLQQTVSITAAGVPLADILEDLSAKSHVRLTYLRPTGNQRFTVVTHDLPLHALMRQIVKTLSHSAGGADQADQFEWRKKTGGGENQYVLVSLRPVSLRVRAAFDEDRRRMRLLLRELRDLVSRESGKQPKTSPLFPPELLDGGNMFFAAYHAVLRNLSDGDVEKLIRGDAVAIAPALLADPVRAFDKENQEAYSRAVSRAKAGEALPPPPPPFEVGPSPHFRLVRNDSNGKHPGQRHEYALLLDDVLATQWVRVSPYYRDYRADPVLKGGEREEQFLDLNLAKPPEEGAAESAAGDLPQTLVAIARAARINVVQEHFYKLGDLSLPLRGLAPEQKKGSLTQVVNDVCSAWKYTVAKEGNVYRFWSPTWFLDRDCDITEPELKRWRKTLARQGEFTIEDQIRMATEFTWGQIAVTLKQALPPVATAGRNPFEIPEDERFKFLQDLRGYYQLRLQGLLTGEERSAALSENGVAVAALSPDLREAALRAVIARDRIPPTQSAVDGVRAKLATARLFLRPASAAYKKPQPLGVEIVDAPAE